jgi:uncharacterized protein with FMN-binding domain
VPGLKKYYFFILLLVQLFLLISCSNVKSTESDTYNPKHPYERKGSNQGMVNSVFYKDGTYMGEGDTKDYGKEVATITINGGKITDVVFQRLDASGTELFRNESSQIKIESTRRELLKDDIKSDINIMVNEVIRRQSYDISIPTSNKELLLNWRLAVKRAVEKAKK